MPRKSSVCVGCEDFFFKTQLTQTRCFETDGLFCKECVDFDRLMDAEDLMLGAVPVTALSADATSTFTYVKCTHAMVPVQLDQYHQVFLSSAHAEIPMGTAQPDLGVYLDNIWQYSGQILADGLPLKESQIGMPAYHVNWPDFSVIPLMELRELIDLILVQVDAGKRVEIGCVGGHGRTGTLAACLMVASGAEPSAAINSLRKDYCGKAIETEAQVKLIRDLFYHLHPEVKRPPEPAPAPQTSFTAFGAWNPDDFGKMPF